MEPPMMKKTILTSLILAACSSTMPGGDGPGTGVPNPEFSSGVVVAGDFNVSGVLSTVRVPTGNVIANAVAGVAGGDPFVRHYDGEIFVINRDSGDNVTVLDDQTLQLVGQYALQPTWADGHHTGFYTFQRLREECPCPEDTAKREGAAGTAKRARLG
jgi:hypothetical protein